MDENNIDHVSKLFDELDRKLILRHSNVVIRFGRVQFRANPLDSRYKYEGKLYRYWKNNKIVVPNMKGCEAINPERYCFYPDGKVYPCIEIAGNSDLFIAEYYPEFIIHERIENWKNFSVINLDKCKKCKFIAICNGGCPVSNIGVYSNMNQCFCLNMEEGFNNFANELNSKGFFNVSSNKIKSVPKLL